MISRHLCVLTLTIAFSGFLFGIITGAEHAIQKLWSFGVGAHMIPLCLFFYISFLALSQGAAIWLFISENFRAKEQAVGSFTHWLIAYLKAFSFPYILEKLGGRYSFMIFSIMIVFQLLHVLAVMPETKGKSLKELETKIGFNE